MLTLYRSIVCALPQSLQPQTNLELVEVDIMLDVGSICDLGRRRYSKQERNDLPGQFWDLADYRNSCVEVGSSSFMIDLEARKSWSGEPSPGQ